MTGGAVPHGASRRRVEREMERRTLGSSGTEVSAVAFGCGPVPALLTGDAGARQTEVVRRAIELGVSWFDTAAGYGDGRSERNLGAALRELGSPSHVHVATKARVNAGGPESIREQVLRSFGASLERLGLERVTLFQLHNAVTRRRDDLPTSLAVEDVLGRGGVAGAFEEIRGRGQAAHVGLTGLGDAESLGEVVASGVFEAVQAPLNLLEPAGGDGASTAVGGPLGLPGECAARGIAFFAIRVLAGGALAGRPPGEYTRVTRFFPLELYRRDEARVARLRAATGADLAEIRAMALRFAIHHRDVTSAILGLATAGEVEEAVRAAGAGPPGSDDLAALESFWREERRASGGSRSHDSD